MEDITSTLSQAQISSDVGNQVFPFFSLPSELRSKILLYHIGKPCIIDLDPSNYYAGRRRLNLFLTSHRMHDEASHLFYSAHTFRIFPTHGRFLAPRTLPLLVRLPRKYREALVTLELRLGPGWNSPPKSWWVDSSLGLEEMQNVRTLNVFVEIDPSHNVFKGFRIGKDFFTDFGAHLLSEVIRRLPNLQQVRFDAWPSVMRRGPLMERLLHVAMKSNVNIINTLPCNETGIASPEYGEL
ncbi:hypothetical protein ACLMJK_008662 [Lecanora helva]